MVYKSVLLIQKHQLVTCDINCHTQQLADKELHKSISVKFEKRKVHSSFVDNIWGADLADTEIISKFNKRT